MMFSVGPDLDVSEFDIRLCSLEISRVGEGLPCTELSHPRINTVRGNSSDDSKWEDQASVDIGRACPANYPERTGDGGNEFGVRVIYELPDQQAEIAALSNLYHSYCCFKIMCTRMY